MKHDNLPARLPPPQLPGQRYPWNSTALQRQRMPPVVVGIAAALGTTLAVGGITATVLGAVLSTLVGLALNFVMGKLFAPKRPRPEQVKNELRRATSLPFKRFAYGEFFAPGSPAGWQVSADILFGPLILNSRPSDGTNLALRVDGKDVPLTGDAFDFSGSGAVPSGGALASHLTIWIGLGDQTGPPDDLLAEFPSKLLETDAWEGITVAWVRLAYGAQENARDRWRTVPPEIDVSMRWSLVWDWRDVAQSLASPATWAWSDNHALCLLDAHTQNPIQPYQEDDLDIAGGWTDAADAADDAIALDAGGTEKRYTVDGLLIFNSAELAELFTPLYIAGAAEPTTIGGQTSIVPGVYLAPKITVVDIVGDGFEWETLQPGRDIANTIRATYRNEDRAEELADLPPYSIAGAVAADGGVPTEQRVELAEWVVSPTQAARIQKIAAHRARAQKRLIWELPPECFDMVAGAAVTIALAEPYDVINGVYQAEEVTPVLIDVDEAQGGGVAMRLSCTLREYASAWFAWDETTEEPDIPEAETLPGDGGSLPAPASLNVTSSSRTSGETTVIGAILEWPPVSTEVLYYETQYRVTGEDWQAGPDVQATVRDSTGDVFVFISPLESGVTYDFRVRSAALGRVSPWVTETGVDAEPPANSLTAPTDGSATAISPSQIVIAFTTPNEIGVRGLAFYGGDTSDTGTMSELFGGAVFAGPNQTVQATEFGLSASQTRYYATRTIDQYFNESAFSAVVSDTTDP